VPRLSLILCLLLSGCSGTGSGAGIKWYNPTTWMSGSAGRSVTDVNAKTDTAESAAIGAAQKSAHETQAALFVAPASRQVDVARMSNDNAVALLDQVAGPLTAKEMAEIREKVRLLVSDLADERARGEAMRLTDQRKDDRISALLSELAAEKEQSVKNLSAAFERENGLANELRNERWWSWFWRITIGAGAILAVSGYVYLRLTLGGLPTALGSSLAKFRAADPDAADRFTRLLDIPTTPAEQAMISLIASRHS
jgi:hypothetical protein